MSEFPLYMYIKEWLKVFFNLDPVFPCVFIYVLIGNNTFWNVSSTEGECSSRQAEQATM